MVYKSITHAISTNCLVLTVCMLRASSLEQWVWCMERSGLAIHDFDIIYSQITSFPINTRLNAESVWGSDVFGFCWYTKHLPVHKSITNLLIKISDVTLKYSGTYFNAASDFKATGLLFKYISYYNLSSCLAEIPVLFMYFLFVSPS